MRPEQGKVWRKAGRNGREGTQSPRRSAVLRCSDGNVYPLTAAQAWLLTLKPSVPVVAQAHTAGGVS
jgi:hypothetical protein